MKLKIFTTTLIIVSASWAIQTYVNEVSSKPDGSPSGATGSPGDGLKTCAQSGCHTGVAQKTKTGMITSNIPSTGYVPGTTYTITAKATSPTVNRWGFEVSPQSTSGALKGQLIVTNTTQTKLVGSNKYITHKTAGNSGSGTKTWKFNWVAPAAGSGTVKFYGSFLFGNNNGNEKGDTTYTSVMTKKEDTIPVKNDPNRNSLASSQMACPANLNVAIFPNPFTSNSKIELSGISQEPYAYQVISVSGEMVKKEENVNPSISKFFGEDLVPGVYFVRVSQNNLSKTIKIIKTK